MSATRTATLLSTLQGTVEQLTREFDQIPAERKQILNQLTAFVQNKIDSGQKVYLNFICTHNSRRSHLAQIWAQTAAHYYGVKRVECFSGGTEATAFNPRAVKAMKDAGFDISIWKEGENPFYKVKFSEREPALTVYSK